MKRRILYLLVIVASVNFSTSYSIVGDNCGTLNYSGNFKKKIIALLNKSRDFEKKITENDILRLKKVNNGWWYFYQKLLPNAITVGKDNVAKLPHDGDFKPEIAKIDAEIIEQAFDPRCEEFVKNFFNGGVWK